MYQHDTELTTIFAEGNPNIINSAREKLMIPLGHYECVNFHKYWPDNDLGLETICPVCSETMKLVIR